MTATDPISVTARKLGWSERKVRERLELVNAFLRDGGLAAENDGQERCVWTETYYDGIHYYTACGKGMSAYENLEPMKDYGRCLYCGKRIELVRLEEVRDADK